jgi:hypothetical protein
VFNDLGITFVDGAPNVPDQDDEHNNPEDEEEEDDNDDGNVHAKAFPVPSMEGYSFRQPALDTVFREMFENIQIRCLDMRAPVDPAFVE